MLKFMNKQIVGVCITCVFIMILISVWVYSNQPQYSKAKGYAKEYIVGAAGIKGDVDVTKWGDDPAYRIGANSKGYAVFKDPDKALSRLKVDYAKGVEAIQKEFGLRSLSKSNYQEYGTYGWQLTETEDTEAVEQSQGVTAFMDIYENSF